MQVADIAQVEALDQPILFTDLPLNLICESLVFSDLDILVCASTTVKLTVDKDSRIVQRAADRILFGGSVLDAVFNHALQ